MQNTTVFLLLAATLTLAGCSGDTEKSESKSDSRSSASASKPPPTPSESPAEPASEDPFTQELKIGEPTNFAVPPDGLTEGAEPSEVTMTLNGIRQEPSTNTKNNAYVILDMEVKNTGPGPADLRGLSPEWESTDGLLETDVGVFCDEELEYDLQPGQRTVGCVMVDVPLEPATLSFVGVQRTLTVPIDPK